MKTQLVCVEKRMGSEEGDSSFEEEENKEQLRTGVGKRRRNVGYDFYFLALCFKMRHIIALYIIVFSF